MFWPRSYRLLLLLICSEAHPDVIGSDGVASEEAYKNDLAYLKRKVLLLFYYYPSFTRVFKKPFICVDKHLFISHLLKDM